MRKPKKLVLGLVLGAIVAFSPIANGPALAGPAPSPAAVLREPSECLGMFDVWTSGAGFTFIAYYGRDLPFSGSGTLKIWIGSTKWGNWGVSLYTPYDAKSLGRSGNTWTRVELWKGSFKCCDGTYDSD